MSLTITTALSSIWLSGCTQQAVTCIGLAGCLTTPIQSSIDLPLEWLVQNSAEPALMVWPATNNFPFSERHVHILLNDDRLATGLLLAAHPVPYQQYERVDLQGP